MELNNLVVKLISSTLSEDRKGFQNAAVTIMRKIQKEDELNAKKIADLLSPSLGIGLRGVNPSFLPVNQDSRLSLLQYEEISSIEMPVIKKTLEIQLMDFVSERNHFSELIDNGITVPNKLLLYGAPGVGKTYVTRWLACTLHIPLLTVDLASTISSYLGKSGQNLKTIFDFVRGKNCVLLLDEFDAIAKRRDDEGDLGELKRLVNILLKELETVSYDCIVVASTNHPQLLDPAIWRRFDRAIEIPLPNMEERKQIIERYLPQSKYACKISLRRLLVWYMDKYSGSDIETFCDQVKRKYIISEKQNLDNIILSELRGRMCKLGKDEKKLMCVELQKNFSLSQRKISNIVDVPLTTVSRWLNKDKVEEI